MPNLDTVVGGRVGQLFCPWFLRHHFLSWYYNLFHQHLKQTKLEWTRSCMNFLQGKSSQEKQQTSQSIIFSPRLFHTLNILFYQPPYHIAFNVIYFLVRIQPPYPRQQQFLHNSPHFSPQDILSKSNNIPGTIIITSFAVSRRFTRRQTDASVVSILKLLSSKPPNCLPK